MKLISKIYIHICIYRYYLNREYMTAAVNYTARNAPLKRGRRKRWMPMIVPLIALVHIVEKSSCFWTAIPIHVQNALDFFDSKCTLSTPWLMLAGAAECHSTITICNYQTVWWISSISSSSTLFLQGKYRHNNVVTYYVEISDLVFSYFRARLL